jgi:peptidyl-prolyl cis-trans isomerase C
MRTMLTLALLAISISEPAFAQALARVGGVSITLEQVIAADPAAKTDPVARQKALIALIDRQAVINEARNSGLAKSSIYKAAVAEADQNLLINLSAQKYIQDHPISDQMISETYKAVFDKPAPVEYRFRQIIVDSYSSAKTVLTDLKDGQDFSILAGTMSKDASADLGGEVGWQLAARLPAPILKVIKNLKVSEVAGPISIPQGYTVIQLLATRGAPKPTLDQVKGQLTNALEQQEWVNEIIKLRKAQGAQLIVPLSGN